MIHDIERVVDRVICLERGRVVADAELDALKDEHGKNLEQIFLDLVGGADAATVAAGAMAVAAGRL